MSVIQLPPAHKNLINQSILVQNISVIGLGHLGSDIALNLSKLGLPEIYLYDHDTIEDRNISGTPYFTNHIGMTKVEALKDIIVKGSVEKKFVKSIARQVDDKEDLVENTRLYIVATDSIQSRIKIFDAIQGTIVEDPSERYLIDLRSRGMIAEVVGLPLDNNAMCHWYIQHLQSKLSDPTPPVHCNEANIIQNTKFATSIATQIFSSILDGTRELIFFRLNIVQFRITRMDISVDTINKEWDKYKLRLPCDQCGKKHRKSETWEKCHSESLVGEENSQDSLPSREELFGGQ